VFLPAEIGLRTPDGLGQRRSLDGECSLAGTMLVPGIVADGLDESHIE
jgi:hypothetical protein